LSCVLYSNRLKLSKQSTVPATPSAQELQSPQPAKTSPRTTTPTIDTIAPAKTLEKKARYMSLQELRAANLAPRKRDPRALKSKLAAFIRRADTKPTGVHSLHSTPAKAPRNQPLTIT
jgi:hypothetical protein